MRKIYTCLFYILLPFVFIRLYLRGRALPAYRQRWRERLGFVKKIHSVKPVLWFHTVSVGEFIAAIPLIKHYLAENKFEILITTMTPTGSDRVISSFGTKVHHSYIPYDTPAFISRFLKRSQAKKLVCLETELWPNLIHGCAKHSIPIVLANARLSARSAAGYEKWERLTRPMLSHITMAAIQNDEDGERFLTLGLPESAHHICGNIKFDLEITAEQQTQTRELRRQFKGGQNTPLWIAASTHKGEDEIILQAFTLLRKTHPTLRLILVPRHPERFEFVGALCRASGFILAKKSQYKEEEFDILLGDTMGELLLMLGAADFAFIGGSLIENGGHNYIEAAAWAIPIISGPSTYNFREIAETLIGIGAMTIAKDVTSLAKEVNTLIKQPTLAQNRGVQAKAFAERNRGALNRLCVLIDAC